MALTNFSKIYDRFFAHVTDDMFMELTEAETYDMLQDLLLAAITKFEFPRFNINDYTIGVMNETISYRGVDSGGLEVEAAEWEGGYFTADLTNEEIEILAINMLMEWLTMQLATTENTRMKYSGTDFKFSSQANHMAKLVELITEYKEQKINLQRLYSRRRLNANGIYESTMGDIMTTPTYGYNI